MQEAYGPDEESPESTVREATRHLVRSLEMLDRILRTPSRSSDPGPVSLREVLEFLGALHRVHRSPVALDLSHALAQPLPAVNAIEEHLEHALLNVLMNAIEAGAERRDGRITVTAQASGGRVVLDFADNGAGVAEEMRGRLFEPFATTKDDRPFAGLGLAVARGLLAGVGGIVEFEPPEAGGASFIITLQAWH